MYGAHKGSRKIKVKTEKATQKMRSMRIAMQLHIHIILIHSINTDEKNKLITIYMLHNT